MRPFNEAELPVVEPITLDDAVSEGLMLAKYSSRMRLKNRIIVGVLTHERRYDPEQYLGEAKRALGVLIDEFDLEAARIARQLRIAASMPGKAAHAHDYRFADTNNLQLREDTSDALTTALRERRSDEQLPARAHRERAAGRVGRHCKSSRRLARPHEHRRRLELRARQGRADAPAYSRPAGTTKRIQRPRADGLNRSPA